MLTVADIMIDGYKVQKFTLAIPGGMPVTGQELFVTVELPERGLPGQRRVMLKSVFPAC